MKNFLAGISKGILYFLAGVFFTLFIFSFLVVVYLFNENNRLRVEMDGIKNKINSLDIKEQVEKIEPPTQKQVLQTTEPIEEKPISPKPVGINWSNWNNLKRNISADDVVRLIGNPTQIISKIDTTKYIYKDSRGGGYVDFNRLMRVITWGRE